MTYLMDIPNASRVAVLVSDWFNGNFRGFSELVFKVFKIYLQSTDDDEKFSVECERIRDFHHGNKVNVISWSPTTNLLSVPQHLRLLTSLTEDFTAPLNVEDFFLQYFIVL